MVVALQVAGATDHPLAPHQRGQALGTPKLGVRKGGGGVGAGTGVLSLLSQQDRRKMADGHYSCHHHGGIPAHHDQDGKVGVAWVGRSSAAAAAATVADSALHPSHSHHGSVSDPFWGVVRVPFLEPPAEEGRVSVPFQFLGGEDVLRAVGGSDDEGGTGGGGAGAVVGGPGAAGEDSDVEGAPDVGGVDGTGWVRPQGVWPLGAWPHCVGPVGTDVASQAELELELEPELDWDRDQFLVLEPDLEEAVEP